MPIFGQVDGTRCFKPKAFVCPAIS